MGAGNLSSLMNFVSFSEYLGLPVDGFEKEFASLLMKLEGRKMVLHKGGAEGWALGTKGDPCLHLVLIGSFRSWRA